jgi:glycosyltransferase involved in cell wall biosynthesis
VSPPGPSAGSAATSRSASPTRRAGDPLPAVERIVSGSLGGAEIDFSIVVPTHDRPRALHGCLTAISQLAYCPTRYEIVVVDDGSRQSLEPTVTRWIGRVNVTLLRQPNAGPAAARNTGAAVARGRWLAFTDDDCRPDPSWLDAVARDLVAHPDCAVGGSTENGLPRNLLATASQLLLQFLYLHFNPDPRDAVFLASNNLTVPRERFLELGGFDTSFPLAAAEDRELCDRWRWRKGRIVYAPQAIVRHFHDLTLRSFLAQHFNYGRGGLLFFGVKSRRDGRRPPFGGWKLYGPMLAFPFRRERGLLRPIALTALIALSQAMMSLGVLWQGGLVARAALRRRAAGGRCDSQAVDDVARGERSSGSSAP